MKLSRNGERVLTDKIIEGPAYYCGDYIDTDVMSPGRYDPIEGKEELAAIALIDHPGLAPFVNKEKNRTDFPIIIAGREFGCGSSRETAPLALYHAGTRIIIAKSFARIFYRNCINMGGIYPIKLDHSFDAQILNKVLKVDIEKRKIFVGSQILDFPSFGPLEEIVKSGGLAKYTLKMIREKQ
jgi:3-isopropylmalate/(R)-2-methylmalate dehydratase small subunit